MPATTAIVALGAHTANVVVLAAQLGAAEITIELAEDTAIVEARYRLAEPRDGLRLSLIRFPGQNVEPLRRDPTTSDARWEARPGLTWVTVPVSKDGSARLRYRVTGSLTRVPIAVPRLPAEPGSGAVTLTVRGLDGNARLRDGFPRLARQADGSAVARLDNVPGFLRWPPAGNAWSVARGAQVFVVALLVAGSALWAIRARRSGGAGAK
jgi:hypothetical protein